MAAVLVANLIRYKQEGYRPDRDIIVALETDEEIGDANAIGIQWVLKHHRDVIDAEFALNEGAGVGLKKAGVETAAIGAFGGLPCAVSQSSRPAPIKVRSASPRRGFV